MPRVYRTQKGVERLLIREFADALRYVLVSPRWQERPDAVVTLTGHGKRKRVAVEHVEYFNDTLFGEQSPRTRVEDFWRLVQTSLMRRISHRKHLTGISASVRLREEWVRALRDCMVFARRLAAEIVAFAEAHPLAKSQHLSFGRRDFAAFPTLKCALRSMVLSRWTHGIFPASRCAWVCPNTGAGNSGVHLEYVKSAVHGKNQKARAYQNWGDASEKWLLIAASGANASNHAGPVGQNVDWSDPELRALCERSAFDRIVLWERVRCWYRWLKPPGQAVQYDDPYIR